jgi:hypothetical protein
MEIQSLRYFIFNYLNFDIGGKKRVASPCRVIIEEDLAFEKIRQINEGR